MENKLTEDQLKEIEREAKQAFPITTETMFNGHKQDGYTAAATKYLADSIEKDSRIKELEDGLRMLEKPENRDHMVSIASATLSGELAKQLLTK